MINDEVHDLLDVVEPLRWDEVPFENSQRHQHHRYSSPGFDHNNALVGDFIYFDPRSYHEIRCKESEAYGHKPRRIPEDHPRAYGDSNGSYQTYSEGDRVVNNEPGPPGYTVMDSRMAGNACDYSVNASIPAFAFLFGPPAATKSGAMCLALLLSTVSSVTTTANQSEAISYFLREVERPPSEATEDLDTMWDALANRLSVCWSLASNP